MSDIFTDKTIYPHSGKILNHFNNYFENVFIVLSPFFRIPNSSNENKDYKKSKKITYEEALKEFPELNNIPKPNAEFYSTNKDYPEDEEIYKNADKITWSEILSKIEINDYSELNKALRTSIGALREVFRKPLLAERIFAFCNENEIWYPSEGNFNILSKSDIYKTLKSLNKNEVFVTDEFYEKTKTLKINELSEYDFIDNIFYDDYYIYSSDKEILFTIEWDSFFFLMATKDNLMMEKIIQQNLFEGFLCDENTTHDWDYKEGELEKYWDIEKKNEEKSKQNKLSKKTWWKFWK